MVKFRLRKLVFRTARILQRVGAARKRNLSRIGAYVWSDARRMIRAVRGPSAPGRPPHSHFGLLKAGLYFNYDTARGSVRIAVRPLSGARVKNVPGILEHGGTSQTRKGTPIGIEPRPFLLPAWEKQVREGKIDEVWLNSVRMD